MQLSPLSFDLLSRDADEQAWFDVVEQFKAAHIRDVSGGIREFISLFIIDQDRLLACDELLVARQEGNPPIGICTLSSQGESGDGQAGIVAVVTAPSSRKQGLGLDLLGRGIQRMQERIKNQETCGPIKIDCATKAGVALIRKLLAVHPEFKAILQVNIPDERYLM